MSPYSTTLNRWINRNTTSLKASGAETASTVGAFLDIGDADSGTFTVSVTAVSGTPTLLVDIYGSPSGTTRTVTDGVTFNTSTSVGSATALFAAADVGASIWGAGIPVADHIVSVIPAVAAATVNNKALTTNVATLTTAAVHGLTAGQVVVVAGVDATFNGTWLIASVPTTTTFTYAVTHADVGTAAATGTATGISTAILAVAATASASTVSLTISDGFKIATIGSDGFVIGKGTDPTTISAVGTYRGAIALGARYIQYQSRIGGGTPSLTYSVSLDAS
jgi:hypothetical protein